MAKYECEITVLRRKSKDSETFDPVKINSSQIVPGDVFKVPQGQKLPCDAILLRGECVINESMLTGESFPAVKSAIADSSEILDRFSIENASQVKHLMFSGTEVVQNREPEDSYCLALAVRTGFSCEKGEMIKSMLYPAPERFNFG